MGGGAAEAGGSSARGGGAGARGGGRGGGGGGKGPPLSKEEKLANRLQQLDPNAAAAMHERKGLINSLRSRLVEAQAQQAVELTQSGWGPGASSSILGASSIELGD